MYDCFDGIKSNICKIVALFFADDGIILMQSLKETIDSIKILSEIANECGLSINPCPAEYLEVFFKDIFLKQYYSTTNQPISMN